MSFQVLLKEVGKVLVKAAVVTVIHEATKKISTNNKSIESNKNFLEFDTLTDEMIKRVFK